MSFPRGGSVKRKFTEDNENIFSLTNKKKNASTQQPKIKKSASSNNIQNENSSLPDAVADLLTYKTLQEGMLILGCVKAISSLSIQVELPGRIFALITFNCISDQFTVLLKEKLQTDEIDEDKVLDTVESMFQVGHFIPTKIMSVSETLSGQKVIASVHPSDINGDLNHTIIHKGQLVWAAVSSRNDHGYVLDAGIPNCRMFLPHVNIESKEELSIGQPLWSIVIDSQISPAACTIKTSILTKDLENSVQKEKINIHSLIPGMQFNFTVLESIKHGLKGEFNDGCIGYLNENYLSSSQSKLTEYKEGATLKSRLLYVQPVTKHAYLSLRCYDVAGPSVFPIGEVTKAKVISRKPGGLLLKLPNGENGFVSNKRLIRTLPKADTEALADAISKKYPLKSTQTCRIIDYIHMDEMYICTFEQSVIKEKIFTINDIEVGQLVEATISSFTPMGLVVKCGNLKGFIQNFHLSNVKYTDNIKKKFSVGQKLQARIWNIDKRGLYLTTKPALVESNLCLYDYNNATDNKQYPGVIANINRNGILVLFYNDLRGFLPTKTIQQTTMENPQEIFYEGQVIMVTVMKRHDKTILSLEPPKASKRKRIRVGQYVEGVVTEIDQHLTVEVGPNKIKALILSQHLSTSISLSNLLLKTYSVGDVLENLLCISEHDIPILSKREGDIYKQQELKVQKMEDLDIDSLVRGSYQSSTSRGIYVAIPFKPNKRVMLIFQNDLIDKGLPSLDEISFYPEQPIVLKYLGAHFTGKYSCVSDKSCNYAVQFLERYLSDIKRIQNHFLKQGSPISEFQIGNHVNCVINKVDTNGCSVFLENGVQGLVQKLHMPAKNVKPGEKLHGVILWIDYQDMCVELSLNANVIKKINEDQDCNIDKAERSTVHAEVLLTHRDFALGVIKGEKGKQQLIFLPTYLHENSFFKNISYSMFEKIKVIICKKINNVLIGINKKYKHLVKKQQIGQASQPNMKKPKKKANSKKQNNGATLKPILKKAKPKNDSLHKVKIIKNSEMETEVENGNDQEEESRMEDGSNKSDPENDHLLKNGNYVKLGSYNESKDETYEESDEYYTSSDSDDSETDEENLETITLPGVQHFFLNGYSTNAFSKLYCTDSESDEEIAKEEAKNKRKKKLTSQEKEQEIRKKEEELANITDPRNPDEFDRLLLGKPNSSELWAKYIVYYISNAEIDKARATAKRALQTIQNTETTDLLNIRIILLRLELSYGDQDSFNEAFEEAVKLHDSLKIYIEAIKMLAESHKFVELEQKVKKARNKFKQERIMWESIGKVYYENKKLKEARNFRDAALKTLSNKMEHISMIVQFAIMEFKYGERNHAEALFETILQSSPKRTDVWNTYVDQLIKLKDIEGARRVLQRAVSQSIPIKKLKTLYQKFMDFEKKYGSEDTVQYVKESLQRHLK